MLSYPGNLSGFTQKEAGGYIQEGDFEQLDNRANIIYEDKITQRITNTIKRLTYKDAKKLGIRRNTLWHLKKRVKEGKKLRLKRKTVNKLLRQ